MLCFSAGSEEGGNSMLIERMVAIHRQGYSERDRAEFKVHVYRNVFIGIQKLIKAMEALHIPYENPTNKVHCTSQVLIDYSADIGKMLRPDGPYLSMIPCTFSSTRQIC